jgi:hypothetical protein
MALMGRLSEGGVFVQDLFEDETRVLAFGALPACIHFARVGSLRAVGAVGKLLATKRSIYKAWSG